MLEWFWKEPDDLQLKGRPDPQGREAYERRLAGEPVAHALAHLSLIL